MGLGSRQAGGMLLRLLYSEEDTRKWTGKLDGSSPVFVSSFGTRLPGFCQEETRGLRANVDVSLLH
jgi:hypothetical protein